MKEANEETDEYALVLQNAEGVKKKSILIPQRSNLPMPS